MKRKRNTIEKRGIQTVGKYVALLLVAVIAVTGMHGVCDWSIRAAAAEPETSVAPKAEEGTAEPETSVAPKAEEGTAEPEASAAPETEEPDEGEETVTGMPTPTLTPTEAPDGTPNPAPTKEAAVTPTSAPSEGETQEPDTGEVITPEPTETPDGTLIPTPTKEASVSPIPTSPGEENQEPNTEESPSPTPKSAAELPTESNDARYQYLIGIDAQEILISNPPAGYENDAAASAHMKTISVPVWKMTSSGGRYASTFKLTINEKLVKNVRAIFREIYALDIKFPIKVLTGYYYRKVGGVGLSNSTLMSIHSFGAAIDINPGDYDNDYYLGKGNDLRDKSNPYCIPDEVIEIFEKYGWFWGGNFEICSDTMHFQYLGLEFLTYQGKSPFRTVKVQQNYQKGVDIKNLQQRLCELGYKVNADGVYGNKTASAVMKYQKKKGLEATGVVDYMTWETIINETHYMSYVF